MFCMPAAAAETRRWQQRQRAGTRADRMLGSIQVTIPAPLAHLDLAIPGDIAEALETAGRAIAALDAAHGPVLSGLSGLLLRTESVASSKIEHITAGVDDYARAMHGSKANASAISMVDASKAMEGLMAGVTQSRTIGLTDLLDAHRVLMAHEPGEQHYAGRIRDVQNWVGGSDYSPRGAMLVPAPPELLDGLLDDLITFMRRTDLPSLLQATLVHAQFETLHPFTDGNGRIGRALINAVLRVRGTTSAVVVPLASALVARREAYFASLDAYRTGDLEPIVRLFASSAHIAATESSKTAAALRALPEQWRADLGRTRTGSAPLQLLDRLLSQPVIAAADAETYLGSTTSGAYAAIDRLEKAGILRPLTDRKRHQVWGASALLDELADLDSRIQQGMRDQ
ncbi:MAG: Fic family protein [Candidatus Nanopelagicales bacterium]|nr:Fic family protein [Candidatus Nanopelagicales bacterium]